MSNPKLNDSISGMTYDELMDYIKLNNIKMKELNPTEGVYMDNYNLKENNDQRD